MPKHNLVTIKKFDVHYQAILHIYLMTKNFSFMDFTSLSVSYEF